ncbi:MAG: ABC transporter substrate-binding protein [Candidatus Rokuibacteriota bacterium]
MTPFAIGPRARAIAWLAAFVLALAAGGGVPLSAAAPPLRIVSVNITSDEILLALAPDGLIALSVLADDPDVSCVVREARKVPTRVKADSEQILDLRPDLVVIGAHAFLVAAQLEQLGVRVIRIGGFESIAWVERLVLTLGEATGTRTRAREIVSDMRARLETIRAGVAGRPRPRVLTYSWYGSTTGADTILDDVIRAAGGENLAATLGISGTKRLSLEQLIVSDPDALVMSASRRWAPTFPSELLHHPALQGVRAIRGGRVYLLPGPLMITSSHHVVDAVEALARRLHPDVLAGSRP